MIDNLVRYTPVVLQDIVVLDAAYFREFLGDGLGCQHPSFFSRRGEENVP